MCGCSDGTEPVPAVSAQTSVLGPALKPGSLCETETLVAGQ
jgi:hypothetical protein